jgi:hypothetical protein
VRLTWWSKDWLKWRAGNTHARASFFANAPVTYAASYAKRMADYPAQRKWWTASLIALGIVCPSFITTPIAIYLAARTGIAMGYGAYGATKTKAQRARTAEEIDQKGDGYPLPSGKSWAKYGPTDLERSPRARSRVQMKRLGIDPALHPAAEVSHSTSPSVASGARSRPAAASDRSVHAPRMSGPPSGPSGPGHGSTRSRSRGHSL